MLARLSGILVDFACTLAGDAGRLVSGDGVVRGAARRLVQASPAPMAAATCTLTACPCSLTKPEQDMTCCAPKSCTEPCDQYFCLDGKTAVVAAHMEARKLEQALRTALAQPPRGTHGETDAAEADLELLYSVLNAASEPQIHEVVVALCLEDCDTLMRCLYRGLALGNPGMSATFFRWHEHLTRRAGLGCIVRSLVPAEPKRQIVGVVTPVQ
ncbi:hypothetical protein WJX81_006196 [Elliptochloris bilobata]|uniref:Actin-related protein 2/3 complex subunit 5 n=1 Tax=Elliptochloris bilobata TaxID=381761 RepID=A0AAW1SH99_9CHLO